uniref:hypothetical protein n=1 Tax=Roseivirga sp. TaxID=1964215 RepID=UPI004048DDAF
LRFSCVGYKTKEIALSTLKEDQQNRVVLEVSIEELAAVMVENERRQNPLKVLKRALKAIPQNYPNENFTFDAYYREQLLENDAVIKFSDAATTIQQSGYDGNRVKRMNFKTLIKAGRGVMTGNSSFLSFLYGDYLHDHFSQPVGLYDRAQIHDARASLNHSKEDFSGSIIEGPLALVSKDLVRYISFILDSKNFRKYKFQLLETPAENGEWDYMVKFSPKHPPSSLESIQERRKKGKRISRLDILSGEIRIDQKSYAIKQMRYFVSQDFRRHICNLQEMQVKHYGYNVDVDYWQHNGRWQIKRLHRVDEFIYKDTVRQTTTPYHAVTDLVVLDQNPTVDSVMMKNNFIKSFGNVLYDFPLEYNPDFWEAYEAHVPEARLDERLRRDMEANETLEQQFSIKHLRNDSLAAPEATIDTRVTELHGKSLQDDYHWLKDTKEPLTNQRVMNYLREENAYVENYFRPIRRLHRELTNQLYELSDKESESDLVKLYGYFYWSKYVDNNEYKTIYRKKDEPGASEEVFIDITAMAEDKDYFNFGFYSVSPDNHYVAVGLDSTGSNQLTTYIQDIQTGALLSDSLVNTGSFIWAEDASGFFHSKVDEKTNRPVNIQFHNLGTPFESDSVYFSTDNPAISLNIGKTQSKDFIIVNLGSNNTDEQYIARNQKPFVFKKLRNAEKDAQYGMYHSGSKFYILTNIGAPNRRLMVADTAQLAYEHWQELVPGSDTETIIDFAVFEDHLVLHKWGNMQQSIEVLDRKTEEKYVIKEKRGEIYSLSLGRNYDSQSDTLEYYVSAPNYKTRKVKYHLGNRKEKRTIESKDKSFFSVGASTKLIWVNARDGAKIPVSLVTWGRWNSKENAPLFVEAYGAYGASQSLTYNSGMEPLFLLLLLGLLNSFWYEILGKARHHQYQLPPALPPPPNTLSLSP